MKKLLSLWVSLLLVLASCSDDNAIVGTQVSYDSDATLAVSVRVANESYDASTEQNCGNSSHYGIANLQVNVLGASEARSAESLKVVAAGQTSNRGSVVFNAMEIGDYVVQVTRGEVTLEKPVSIKAKKRFTVIMDF